MSVECVAIFWVVNASSGENSCLQFSIPTGFGAGGEGGVSHTLNAFFQTENFSKIANNNEAFYIKNLREKDQFTYYVHSLNVNREKLRHMGSPWNNL